MATFSWVGRTKDGAIQKGEMSAASQADVVAQLRGKQITPTTIEKKGGSWMDIQIPGFEPKVEVKDVVIFTRQFSTMIDAGLPLVQCLEILGEQTENPTLAKAIKGTRLDVESGSTYAEALRKHPKVFDELYVNMVAAGEAGGILDIIQQRLAAYMEKAIKLEKKIKGAMVYPAVIVVISAGVMAVLMIWVIPVFASMFSDFGGQLPGPTQLVLNMSDWVIANIGYMVGGIIAFKMAFSRFYKTETGKRELDRLSLKIPVVGDLIRKAAVAKFTRTMSTLMNAGVPILEGLEIVASTAGNKIVEMAILKARLAVSEGQDLAGPLSESGVFPKMVTQMMSVGEATGALDTMMNKIADFYDDEVDDAVSALTAMMEPALMVFLGITVGFIVIAMYLPIFEMGAAVG